MSLPKWTADFVRDWQQKLLLQEWTIRLKYDAKLGDIEYETVRAECVPYIDIRVADITLDGSVSDEPTPEWEQTIIHELIHIRLAVITQSVVFDLIPLLGVEAQRVAQDTFRRNVEYSTEMIAQAFWSLE